MIEDTASEEFRRLGDSQLVSVYAVIGEYNSFLYGINRNVSFRSSSILEQEIGYVPLEILRRELPKVYESVKRDIEAMKSEVPSSCPF